MTFLKTVEGCYKFNSSFDFQPTFQPTPLKTHQSKHSRYYATSHTNMVAHIMSNEIVLTFRLGGTYHNSMKSFKYMTARRHIIRSEFTERGWCAKTIENFLKRYGHLASAAFDA